MKKSRLSFFAIAAAGLVIMCYSCSNQEKSNDPAPAANVATPETGSSGQGGNPEKGAEIYKKTCAACHQANGEGIASTFPPLAASDYLLADRERAILQVIKGSSGEITVNGSKYSNVMPPQNLSDEEIADVLTYVNTSWGNTGSAVSVEEVKSVRGKSN